MATFLFASIPVPAHTTNPLPFAQRLVERGHRVLWYAGRRFHAQLEAAGAEPLGYTEADDFGDADLEQHFPQLAGLEGAQAISRAFADVFVGQAPARVADLRRILAEHPVDAMLCDGLMYGVGLAHELGGPAWATFGDGPLPYFDADTPPFGPALLPMKGPVGRLRNRVIDLVGRTVVFRPAQRRYDAIRRDLGLPRATAPVLDESTSPYLHLQGAVPSFDYPRRDLPGHLHWVGALRPDPPRDWTPPVWWPEVTGAARPGVPGAVRPEVPGAARPEVTGAGRPVVLVSQGSIRPDPTELIVPAVRALADRDVLVVVTTGQGDPAELELALGEPLPANVRTARFVPYDLVLPHVSCFVTNGGYTGVTLALAHGVPLVQAGLTEEKAEIAARIHWTGVGVRLGVTRPEPSAVADGVARVLGEPSFAAAAGRVREEMAGHDAGTEGADLLEQLAATQRAVLRGALVA